jgi:hypothetical protein
MPNPQLEQKQGRDKTALEKADARLFVKAPCFREIVKSVQRPFSRGGLPSLH